LEFKIFLIFLKKRLDKCWGMLYNLENGKLQQKIALGKAVIVL